MKRVRLSVLAVVVLFVLVTAYSELENDTTAELANKAVNNKEIQFKPLSKFSNIRVSDYSEARRVFWKQLYPNKAVSLYCAQTFKSNQRAGFNIEHVFPMSWVTNGLSCGTRNQCRKTSAIFNKIEADLHNLYPSRSDVNEKRSSYRFGLISSEKREFGKTCDFEYDARQRIAEPAPNVRGDIARAMFYMASEYKQHGLVIFKKQVKLLRDWHKSDPPSNSEKSRNSLIEQIQGNRNPFIDAPHSLIELIESGHFTN